MNLFTITYRNADDNKVDSVNHRGTIDTAIETAVILSDHEAVPGTPVRVFSLKRPGGAQFILGNVTDGQYVAK